MFTSDGMPAFYMESGFSRCDCFGLVVPRQKPTQGKLCVRNSIQLKRKTGTAKNGRV